MLRVAYLCAEGIEVRIQKRLLKRLHTNPCVDTQPSGVAGKTVEASLLLREHDARLSSTQARAPALGWVLHISVG